MAEQVRQPAAIVGVGFMTAPVPYIKGVGQHDFDVVLQKY